MEIDNQTNDPVDYEQVGSGPDVEDQPGPPCPVTGSVPGSSRRPFAPCGRPPFTVEISGSGNTCTATGITRPNAAIVVRSLTPCDVEVEE